MHPQPLTRSPFPCGPLPAPQSGRSPLHVRPDGAPLLQPPTDDTVREAVVRLAVAAQLVTPYTSAVGVALRRDPLDPQRVDTSEVPLQVGNRAG